VGSFSVAENEFVPVREMAEDGDDGQGNRPMLLPFFFVRGSFFSRSITLCVPYSSFLVYLWSNQGEWGSQV
jgi:hypothetical protein